MEITSLLATPAYCTSHMGLPFRDKRRGGIWYCNHARQIVGKGKKQPDCLCKAALESARPSQPIQDERK